MFLFRRFVMVCLLYAALLLVCEAESGCPKTCSCAKPDQCPPGVHLISDLCGCGCKVCAQQLNKKCSNLHPCDQTKNLHCDFGARPTASYGICRAQETRRSCFLNGTVYQHGETFQPVCSTYCSCQDGTIGCAPACPLQMPVLGPLCRNPRLVKVPRKCCKEWQCENHESNRIEVTAPHEGKLVMQKQETAHSKSSKNNFDGFGKTNMASKASFNAIPLEKDWKNTGCHVIRTEWSDCSMTCGLGISYRTTTDNQDCQPRKETRLCQIRPCGHRTYLGSKSKGKCTKIIREEKKSYMTYKNCTSIRMYWPKYCGICTDGRTCKPSKSRTILLKFHCDTEAELTMNMLWIENCSCENHGDKQKDEKISLVFDALWEKNEKNAMKARE
ncbi:CCN family member 1-like [Protopterus annectens]|uniref:CCN family member 1-like n=1 Tax=Protopterus annectens TaxID=7888 RepID=UPI001CFAF663|nr:CCN family member 1-like [Protopterus annectens]